MAVLVLKHACVHVGPANYKEPMPAMGVGMYWTWTGLGLGVLLDSSSVSGCFASGGGLSLCLTVHDSEPRFAASRPLPIRVV